MTRNRSSWFAKGRRLASSAYHRTVGEVVQRRRSRAYMAAGGSAAPSPSPPPRRSKTAGRDAAVRSTSIYRENELLRARVQTGAARINARAGMASVPARTGRTPR